MKRLNAWMTPWGWLSLLMIFLTILIVSGCGSENKSEINANSDSEQVINSKPFAKNSIWNRQIPVNIEYVDVQDAIWGDPAQTPTMLYPDLVAVYIIDQSQPPINFRLNKGWNYPERSMPDGEILFQRRLPPESGIELRYPDNGNAMYVIIDPFTGLADEGTGAWRDPGSDFLTFMDFSRLHNIDVINGDGLLGARGSRLPALGGLIRSGEINSNINHAMAVTLSSRRYSKDVHFVWPASNGDGFASDPIYGYLGDNPYYTIGTLLAIPHDIDLDLFIWITPQGSIVAAAAQLYGWYIVDSSTGRSGGNGIGISFERKAAYTDLGLTIDPDTNKRNIDPDKIDIIGFDADIQQILHMVKAVKNNL